MVKVIIFDFDGTLVDTVIDVAICFNKALELCGFPTHPVAAFDRFVGGNLETVVSKMLPDSARSMDNIDTVKNVYRQLYIQSDKPNTKPYPEMAELLMELKGLGFRIAVNSNKGQQLLEDIVVQLFPPSFFDSVVGYIEDKPPKPDPYGVDEICRQCGCTRMEAVYVGDGETDLATATNAEIPCIFVTWGQGDPMLTQDSRVYGTASNMRELGNVLRKINRLHVSLADEWTVSNQ